MFSAGIEHGKCVRCWAVGSDEVQ